MLDKEQEDQALPLVDQVLIFFGVVLCSGAVTGLLGSSSAIAEGNTSFQLWMLFFYIVVGLRCLVSYPSTFVQLVAAPAVAVILLYCMLSIAWSMFPEVTLRRVVGLAGATLFAVYVARVASLNEFFRIAVLALAACAVLTILVAALLPAVGTDPRHDGAWLGGFVHKNQAGRVLGLGLILAAAAPVQMRLSVRLLTCLVFVVPVIGSESRTAWVAVPIALVALFLLQLRSRRVLLLATAGLIVAGIAFLFFDGIAFVLEAMERDSSLTGRTGLWTAIITAFGERPILGYGYRGFWVENNPIIPFLLGSRITGHSHNAYLDVLVELGVIGAVIFAASMFWIVKTGLQYPAGQEGHTTRALHGAILVYGGVIGVVASDLLDQNNLIWLLFILPYLFAKMEKAKNWDTAATPYQTAT